MFNRLGQRDLLGSVILDLLSCPPFIAAQDIAPPISQSAAGAEATTQVEVRSPASPYASLSFAALVAAQSFRGYIRTLFEQKVRGTGLPVDVPDAVVRNESNYDPSTIGAVGEVGLKQIRWATAARLSRYRCRIGASRNKYHYGVMYLSKAWRLAEGDLCCASMKYLAGHGEEV